MIKGQDEVKYALGKPVLELDLNTATILPDLIETQSFLLFDMLGLSLDWLGDKWEQSSFFR